MPGPFDFTGQNINDTYQRLVQVVGKNLHDGTGSLIIPASASQATSASYAVTASQATSASYAVTASQATSASYAVTASYAFSASIEIIKEVSSSYAETSSYATHFIVQNDLTASNVSASFYYGDGSNLSNLPGGDSFPYTGSAIISGSLILTGSFNALLPTSSTDTYFVTYNTSSYELEARQVATLINPKVEYLDTTASIVSGDTVTLPNSLSYISSSTYEYLEIFMNGLRMRYDMDFVPLSPTTIQFQITIPSGSELTFKSLKA